MDRLWLTGCPKKTIGHYVPTSTRVSRNVKNQYLAAAPKRDGIALAERLVRRPCCHIEPENSEDVFLAIRHNCTSQRPGHYALLDIGLWGPFDVWIGKAWGHIDPFDLSMEAQYFDGDSCLAFDLTVGGDDCIAHSAIVLRYSKVALLKFVSMMIIQQEWRTSSSSSSSTILDHSPSLHSFR